jgi:hypothetical protein
VLGDCLADLQRLAAGSARLIALAAFEQRVADVSIAPRKAAQEGAVREHAAARFW